MCELRAGVVRAANRPCASKEQVRDAAELLVGAVCSWRMRAPSGIDLQTLAISIIFGVNLCCMHIHKEIYMILHKKNEYTFGGTCFE